MWHERNWTFTRFCIRTSWLRSRDFVSLFCNTCACLQFLCNTHIATTQVRFSFPSRFECALALANSHNVVWLRVSITGWLCSKMVSVPTDLKHALRTSTNASCTSFTCGLPACFHLLLFVVYILRLNLVHAICDAHTRSALNGAATLDFRVQHMYVMCVCLVWWSVKLKNGNGKLTKKKKKRKKRKKKSKVEKKILKNWKIGKLKIEIWRIHVVVTQ